MSYKRVTMSLKQIQFYSHKWIINTSIKLISEVAIKGKPFEMYNKNFWQLPQVKLFGSFFEFFALRTVPT